MTSARIESPCINALRHDVAEGNTAAIDDFWTLILKDGTPLIEDCDDEAYRLVTFAWQGGEQTQNVVLISEIVYGWWWNDFAESKLFQLGDSDLWYRTYRVRADARFLYRLAPNHSLLHPLEVVDWDAYRAPQQPGSPTLSTLGALSTRPATRWPVATRTSGRSWRCHLHLLNRTFSPDQVSPAVNSHFSDSTATFSPKTGGSGSTRRPDTPRIAHPPTPCSSSMAGTIRR